MSNTNSSSAVEVTIDIPDDIDAMVFVGGSLKLVKDLKDRDLISAFNSLEVKRRPNEMIEYAPSIRLAEAAKHGLPVPKTYETCKSDQAGSQRPGARTLGGSEWILLMLRDIPRK
ncbi:hypothetical protein EYC80_009765 [Monilinia laxa]|uniref:Uncharacterized protein n=1 Tax=Monilinia laxa TaxID=61186 RepID=A0A5N6JQM2_MONLA|nr:hypothetical protein EYC80_009765 [Monilinia laxa]